MDIHCLKQQQRQKKYIVRFIMDIKVKIFMKLTSFHKFYEIDVTIIALTKRSIFKT